MKFRQELLRKGLHITGLAVPVIYWFSSKSFVLQYLIPITIIALAVDTARIYIPMVKRVFYRVFGTILRQHERNRLSGTSYFLPACVLVILIFPKIHVILSLFFLTISDTSAALFGKKYGKHPVLDKTWEGTTAFLFTALIIAIYLPGLDRTHAIIGAFSATAIELLPIPIDDNFRIPVGTCIILYLISL